ncbi:MAG: LD-carboxypeptidase [Betaproteobacteria bacterium]|nr:LD-carboxypeptidase [Betaproteobacteria bacterium]
MTIRPYPALLPGLTIGVIAPAGPASEDALLRAPAVIENLGYAVRMFPGCYARQAYLAGDDDCRLADLHAAFRDPDIAAILCLRGGYGSGRLLDRIDVPLLLAHAKPLIGYSDITALHALLSNAGIASFHGPMLTSDLLDQPDPLTLQGFACLRDGLTAGAVLRPELSEPLVHIAGSAGGRLVGGNLSIVASLLGTPWALDTRDAILFLEDTCEAPYRIDRLLQQLRLAGVLDSAAGFLLGSFTGMESPVEVLRSYLEPLGKPVLSGWPAGHCSPNTLLPLGAFVDLDSAGGTVTLREDLISPNARSQT